VERWKGEVVEDVMEESIGKRSLKYYGSGVKFGKFKLTCGGFT
jgi:hypothetical protein